MKKPKPRTIWQRHLLEDLGAPSKVDRQLGIVYGVKVLGTESPNTHGLEEEVPDLQGTRYTLECMRKAIPLYEAHNKVNCDHPDRARPNSDRSAYDRLGELKNYRVESDGLYADLHLLKAHPMSERVMEAAEKMPSAFGLSHNARGRGMVQNKWWVIEEITEVRHVDLVADPGSNRSLFESRDAQMKLSDKTKKLLAKGLKTTLDTLEAKEKQKFVDLLEMGDALAQMNEDDTTMTTPEEEPGYQDHCAEMVKAIILDTELSPDDKIAKIKKCLKLLEEEGVEEEDDTEESDEKDAPNDGKDHKPGKDEGFGGKADARESKQRKRSKNPEVRDLQEQLLQMQTELKEERLKNWVSDQVAKRELTGKVSAELLESITATGDRKKIEKALDQIKALAGNEPPPKKKKPQSAAITRAQVDADIAEARRQAQGDGKGKDDDDTEFNHVPKKPDDQLAWLMS